MHGKFGWNELATNNVEGAKAYYARTIGWTYEKFPMPEGEYWIAKAADGTAAAGIMVIPPDDKESQPGWLSYLAVDDLDQRLAAITAAHGEVLMDPLEIPGVGRIAVVADPAGAIMGLMTAPPAMG